MTKVTPLSKDIPVVERYGKEIWVDGRRCAEGVPFSCRLSCVFRPDHACIGSQCMAWMAHPVDPHLGRCKMIPLDGMMVSETAIRWGESDDDEDPGLQTGE